MNDGQIKLDNKDARVDTIIPSKIIDKSFISQAQSDYQKKKQEERRLIVEQLNRAVM